MSTCSRNGCKKIFVPEENKDGDCVYHPGTPVFHEGLKSWSCCSDTNKPVLDFDDFMKIQGCRKGMHTTESAKPEKPKSSDIALQSQTTEDGKEIYTRANVKPAPLLSDLSLKPKEPEPQVEGEDDPSIPVAPGTRCQHAGCMAEFVSEEESRGENSVCVYHPSSPIFHEGSKGYLCCKRRVLEFDEFLKIEGCKKGKHLFAPKKKNEVVQSQATCRVDYYQTPQTVCVSIFTKQVDKEQSLVEFVHNMVRLDLLLPDTRRFVRTLELSNEIVPEESSYRVLGSKVELNLKKNGSQMWQTLEKGNERGAERLILTFGVSGRVGTVGSVNKPVLAEDNNRARLTA